MYKYILTNTTIGEIIVVWDETFDLIKQIILPNHKTGHVTTEDILYHGVVRENHPEAHIRKFLSKLKKSVLGKDVSYDFDILDFTGLTDFQKSVLFKQFTIPKGKVTSYKCLASLINRPRSARPVANVLSRNLFPIVIPCHRTVRSDWHVGGYCGENNNPFKKVLLVNEGIRFKKSIIIDECRFPFEKIEYKNQYTS